MNTKSWIYLIITSILIGLVSTVSMQSSRIRNLKEELSYSIANEKALFAEMDSLNEQGRVLQLTVEQLNYVNDSIIVKMNDVRRELGVKDRNIRELEYQLSEARKTDTLVLRDTIFRDPEFKVDTTLGDRWYSFHLKLEYPSTVIASPKFVSERYVVQSLRRETVSPPKKCWLGRLFQRKHIVMETVVEEKNPYMDIKRQKYIKIVE